MKRILSILLCLVLLMGLLPGCSAANDPEAYVPTGDALEKETVVEAETVPESDQEQSLSLAYYADRPLNPLKSTDYTNRVLIPLLYQGLFAVNRDYEAIPILCKSYSTTADLMTYEFTLDERATFSDGTPVTPEDVVESLRVAKKSTYYSGRLYLIKALDITEDGRVQVKLTRACENLPLLLDVPILKVDQQEEDYPLGSGPYVLGGTESFRFLSRRSNWWCQSKDLLITAQRIPLVAATSTATIRDAFEFEDVGVVCTDPGSDRYVEYRCDYELWDCESGIFLYLGVNADSAVFKNQEVRQALSRGIDRDYLVDNYYRGFARSAELPASPNSPYYTETLANQYSYDGLVYQSMMSSVKNKTIRLLVNQGDSLRVKVAQEIGRMLSTSGVIVEVVSKSPDAYKSALKEGTYDLYLGQTKLSATMDLTAFFSETGMLNYGKMDDIALYNLCLQALENQGNYYTLHQAVMEAGYLCPVLFRSYAVYATRGLVTDLKPARDNLFCYSIGRTLTDAYSTLSE